MNEGVPFTMNCAEAKIISFNSGKTKEGVGFVGFTIKSSKNNVILDCSVFDDNSNHDTFLKATQIKIGSYYLVSGEYVQKISKSGDIIPCLKVTNMYFCHDDMFDAKRSKPIGTQGFGR